MRIHIRIPTFSILRFNVVRRQVFTRSGSHILRRSACIVMEEYNPAFLGQNGCQDLIPCTGLENTIVPRCPSTNAPTTVSVQPSSRIAGGNFEDANFGHKIVNNIHYAPTIRNKYIAIKGQSEASEKLALPGSSGVQKRSSSFESDEDNAAAQTVKKKIKGAEKDGVIKLASSIVLFAKKRLKDYDNIFEGERRTSLMGFEPEKLVIKRLEYNDKAMAEASNLRSLSGHQNIVNFIAADHFAEGEFDFIFIAMERCCDENLYEQVLKEKGGDFDEGRAISRSRQIAKGLQYIHQRGITHSDLKPHNVLICLHDKHTLKITDFGMSKKLEHGASKIKRSTPVGTDGFRAPETYSDNISSKKSDVFSLGLTIFFVCSNGLHPFGDQIQSWNHYISRGENCNLSRVLVSPEEEWIICLEEMLKHNEQDRPTVDQVLEQWPVKKDSQISSQQQHEDNGAAVNELTDEVQAMSMTNPRLVMFDKSEEFMIKFDPYNRKEKPCELHPEMMTKLVRETFSAVAIKNAVYVLLWRRFVYRSYPFDENPTWEMMSPMLEGHGKEPPAVVLEDCIYVCGGGWNERRHMQCYKGGWRLPLVSSCVEKFDPQLGNWVRVPDMNEKRRHNQVVSDGDHCIYCIGGIDGDGDVLRSVEKYSSRTKEWKTVAPLNEGRYSAAVATLKGKIYVFGGMDEEGGLDSVERYDPSNDLWVKILKLEDPRSHFRACVIKGTIFLVGGNREQSIDSYGRAGSKVIAKIFGNMAPAGTIVLFC